METALFVVACVLASFLVLAAASRRRYSVLSVV